MASALIPRDELTEIYDAFSSWDDPLSKQILRWIQTSRDIDVLKNQILLNPLFRIPEAPFFLTNPILERGIPWERWTWEAYYSLGKDLNSPYDGQKKGEAIEHTLAERMIKWLNPSAPCTDLAVIDTTLVVQDEFARDVNYGLCCRLAELAISDWKTIEHTAQVKANTLVIKARGENAAVEIAKSKERMAADAAAFAAEREAHRVSLERARQGTVAVCAASAAGLQNEHGRLSGQAEQIAAASARKDAEIKALEEKIKGVG